MTLLRGYRGNQMKEIIIYFWTYNLINEKYIFCTCIDKQSHIKNDYGMKEICR